MINVTTLIFKLSISHFLMEMFLAIYPMESIYLNSFVLLEHLAFFADFNTCNKLLTQKLLKQGYRYHKIRKTFSKFYRGYYDLISKFQIGLINLSCAKDFLNLNSMVTWFVN